MILDENIQTSSEKLQLSDSEIFTKIWTSPRLVLNYLNENKYDKFVHILLIAAGISSSLDKASTKNMGDNMSLFAVLALCILVGGLLGWVFYYIYAALISWTGKWIKGQGDTEAILRMLSYAMIPSVVGLILLIPQLLIFGNNIFQSDLDIYNQGTVSMIIFYFTLFLEFTLGIWTIVLFVIGISEAQKFSIVKSIFNMILPGLIIIIPIAIIAFILGDLLR